MLRYLVFVIVTANIIYILYHQGYLITKCIVSVLFQFHRKADKENAALVSCSGWVKHVVRFRKNHVYVFSFNCQLSKGAAEVTLLDEKKQEILRLDRALSKGTAALDRRHKYYIRWEFKAATGRCELRWQSIN